MTRGAGSRKAQTWLDQSATACRRAPSRSWAHLHNWLEANSPASRGGSAALVEVIIVSLGRRLHE